MIFPVCFTISWSISTSWLNSNFGCFGSQCFAFADPCFVTYTQMMFPSKIPMKHGFPWILFTRLSDSWGHHWLSGISMVKHANSSELIRKLGINPLGRFSWPGGLFECNVLQRCLYIYMCVCFCWALLNLHPCQKSWHTQYPWFLLLEIMCSTIIFPDCKPQVLFSQPVIQGSYPFPSIESYRWCVIYIYIHMCVQPRVSTISIPICIF